MISASPTVCWRSARRRTSRTPTDRGADSEDNDYEVTVRAMDDDSST